VRLALLLAWALAAGLLLGALLRAPARCPSCPPCGVAEPWRPVAQECVSVLERYARVVRACYGMAEEVVEP
jgi:hypothetical protein